MNRPDWLLSDSPNVFDLDPVVALRQAELGPGELSLLAGGPPCQPFSKSSYWVNGDTRRLNDPRAGTLSRFIDFVDAALPEVILIENVAGLIYNGKDEGIHLLEQKLDVINKRHNVSYRPSVININCADFGVPQTRERVFIVAHRHEQNFLMPKATHYASSTLSDSNLNRHVTTWDVLGDLDDGNWPEHLNPRGKWAELLPSIPEGENYLWHTSHGGGQSLFGWRTKFWSFLLKLAKNRPSWTIQALPGPATGPFHWRSRHLSARELARLQTFPDDYVISGTYRNQHRQLGNAVPPAIGEMLGTEIRNQLMSDRVKSEASFVSRSRNDCPEPMPPSPVPATYHTIMGVHEDHPGVGKGPSAVLRTGR